MLFDHPACRIPELPLGAPAVLTELGAYRPERAVLYGRDFLLLHHYLGAQQQSGDPISQAELAGLEKTTRRIDILLRHVQNPASFMPLYWPEPEHLVFTTDNPVLDAQKLQRKLIQAEELELAILCGTNCLEFWRCG